MTLRESSANPRQSYFDDGFCLGPVLIPEDLVARAIRGTDAVLQERYETGVKPHARHFGPYDPPAKLRKIDQPHLCDSAIRELVTFPPIGQWVGELLGAAMVQAWAVQLLIKPPGAQDLGNVGWHQDQTYWPYWEGEVFTVWVALNEVTPQSGPMRFVRGSHRWGIVEGFDLFGHGMDGLCQSLRLSGDVHWEEVPSVMKAGGFSINHSLTLHGSSPNRDTLTRRSVAIHMRTEKSRVLENNYYTDHLDDPAHAPVIYRG